MASPELVSVFDPATSTYGTVPAEQLSQAVRAGMIPESLEEKAQRQEAEQYDTLGQSALAGAEAVARGGSLGLSDVALRGLGDDPAAMERRRRLNPLISAGGEIGGAIAPVLLSGGGAAAAEGGGGLLGLAPSALAARAGAAAEGLGGAAARGLGIAGESAIGRAALRGAEMGAGGLAEGALFGAGNALSEEALSGGDYDSLGEKMLAGAKTGGLFGALAGGALGGTLGLASRTAELGGEALRKRLASPEFANEQTARAMNWRPSDVAKLGPKKAEQVAEDVRNYTLRDGTRVIEAGDNAEQIAAKVKLAKDEVTEDLGRMRQTVEDAGDSIDAGKYLRDVDSEVLSPLRKSPSPTIRAKAGQVEEELAQLRARNDAFQEAQRTSGALAKRIDSELIEKIAQSKSPAMQARAGQLRQILTDFRDSAAAGSVTRETAQGLTDSVLLPLMRSPSSTIRRAARELMPEVEATARAITEPVTYGELRAQQQALKEVVYPKRPPGAGLPPAPPAHAEALMRAERLLETTMEDHVEKTLARVAPDQAGQYAQLRRKAESLIKADKLGDKVVSHAQGLRMASPSDMGTGLAVAAGSLAGGGGGLLGLAKGAAAGLIHNQIRTRGNSFLVRMADAQSTTNAKIANAVHKLLTGASQVRRLGVGETSEVLHALDGRKGESQLDAFKRIQGQLSRATIPDRTVADVEAPNVADAMRATAQRGISFLQSKLPLPLTAPNPLIEPLDPHPAEIDKFSRYYQAVNDPMSVVEGLQHGDVSAEATEALKAVYPKLYSQVQGAVAAQLAEQKTQIAYSKRIALGTLLEIPTDRSLDPTQMAMSQAALNQQQPSPNKPQNVPPAKPMAKSFQSEAESLESQELAI